MESNNKRIAQNAVMLYFRMFVSMAIGFYTSRVVLEALGVSDFGVYNLVGGIVVMMGMINGALNNATTRFLTYGLGLKDESRLKTTFSTAFLTHLALSVFFLVLAESLGLWIVNTQLVIPQDRMVAANWAYQSAILSTALGITQVPYNASITSHERFGIFAALDITNSVLKLTIALIVLYSGYDHLIEYSLLYTIVAITIMLCYRIYCIRNFMECRIDLKFSKSLFKEMFSFTGWNLFGNVSFTLYQQSENIIINNVWGTILNAAVGVAFQVQAVLYGFIGNISTSFVPQITKEYAIKNYIRVNELVIMGSKLSVFVYLLIAIPVILKMDVLASIWLVQVPAGCIDIARILLFCNIFNCLTALPGDAINATGKNKSKNIIEGIIFILQIPLIYLTTRITNSYLVIYCLHIIPPVMTMLSKAILLYKYMPNFRIQSIVIDIAVPAIFIAIVSLTVLRYLSIVIYSQFFSTIIVFIASCIIVLLLSCIVLFNHKEREQVKSYLKTKVFKLDHEINY